MCIAISERDLFPLLDVTARVCLLRDSQRKVDRLGLTIGPQPVGHVARPAASAADEGFPQARHSPLAVE